MKLAWLEPFGCAITGLQLATTPLDSDTAAFLDAMMAVHGIIIFRGQGRLEAKAQLAATAQFGSGVIYSTHAVHPKAEHTEVFRLSNDPEQGFVQNAVRTTGLASEGRPRLACGCPKPRGFCCWRQQASDVCLPACLSASLPQSTWHHDGTWEESPFGHVSYHVPEVPKQGQTCFAHTGIAFDLLPRSVATSLSWLAYVNSHSGVLHPVVYPHPMTQRLSIFAETQLAAVLRLTSQQPLHIEPLEPTELEAGLAPLREAFDNPACHYDHEWRQGDLVVSNNLSVVHRTGKGVNEPDSLAEQGLRVLHRVTVLGQFGVSPAAFEPAAAPWLARPARPEDGYRDLGDTSPFGHGVWAKDGYKRNPLYNGRREEKSEAA
eukprot:SAG22_NODE_765_length_7393_cov_5.670003_4_plen_376_part_00